MEYKVSQLKQFKQIALSEDERVLLRARVAQAITAPAPKTEPIFQRGMQHGLRIALSSFLFVIFVGSSISAVASNALPGDPLYAVKTNINEEIKAAFLSTPEEKVAFAKNRVEKRVGEIKTLAETKTLTKEKQAKAQKALDANIKDLSDELGALSEASPNSALSVTATLEENLKADKQAIQNAFAKNGVAPAGTLETIDGTLKKVSEQEVKILSKQIQHIADELEATSTDAPDESVDDTTTPATTPLQTAPTTPVSP